MVGVVVLVALVVTLQDRPSPSPSYPTAPPQDAVTFEEFLHGEFRAKYDTFVQLFSWEPSHISVVVVGVKLGSLSFLLNFIYEFSFPPHV